MSALFCALRSPLVSAGESHYFGHSPARKKLTKSDVRAAKRATAQIKLNCVFRSALGSSRWGPVAWFHSNFRLRCQQVFSLDIPARNTQARPAPGVVRVHAGNRPSSHDGRSSSLVSRSARAACDGASPPHRSITITRQCFTNSSSSSSAGAPV